MMTDLPPYDPARLRDAPFPERVRLVCRTWASQVHATPVVVMGDVLGEVPVALHRRLGSFRNRRKSGERLR
jgi:hypothetical protein